MTIWEAATAAYEQEQIDAEAQEAARRQKRIDDARAMLQEFVGPDVEIPPGAIYDEGLIGVILHNAEGTRGILVTDAGTVRYVTREPGGQITAQGDPLTSLADLGRLLES